MGKGRAPCCAKVGLNKGSWMPEEDTRLVAYISQYGHGNWRALPRLAGLARCGKSCRLRWINYLRPDIKRGNFTKEEEDTIIKLHGLLGNKWSKIASCLPGRTDNEIKNVWNTHLKKKIANKDQNFKVSTEQKREEASSSSSSITSASGSCSESGSRTEKNFEEINKMDIPIETNFDLSDMLQDFSYVLEQPSFSTSVELKCDDSLLNMPEATIEPSDIWNMIDDGDIKTTNDQYEAVNFEQKSNCGNDSANWMAYLEKELESIREEELNNIANIMEGEDPVASYFQELHSLPSHMI